MKAQTRAPGFGLNGQAAPGPHYTAVRQATVALRAGLTEEDCALQSMPDASPVKWHLAHTSWFFETFVLEQAIEGYRHFDPAFRMLFNSYYVSVGARHPRPERGLISRPGLNEVLAYREHVDAAMQGLCETDIDDELAGLIELGLHHEQQHQELILTDLKHLFSRNPLRPAYRTAASATATDSSPPLAWHEYAGGPGWLGHARQKFSFDNEKPRHRVHVGPFELGSRLVTNGEFLTFIADGGYRRPELWLSDGWDAVASRQWEAPLYWEHCDGRWEQFTLLGMQAVDLSAPVCHVSYYEADAYARWAGARLPREAEWELAASAVPVGGNFVESGLFQPAAPQADAAAAHPQQLYGDVWEWTCSPYEAYPGYVTPQGAVGEYNGKFMCSQYVLRGGSCASPQSHLRATYRNFFPPHARWQFSGIRLARDSGKRVR